MPKVVEAAIPNTERKRPAGLLMNMSQIHDSIRSNMVEIIDKKRRVSCPFTLSIERPFTQTLWKESLTPRNVKAHPHITVEQTTPEPRAFETMSTDQVLAFEPQIFPGKIQYAKRALLSSENTISASHSDHLICGSEIQEGCGYGLSD